MPTDEAVIGWDGPGLPDLNTGLWGADNSMVNAMYYRVFFQVMMANEFLRQTVDDSLDARGQSDLKPEIHGYRAEARFLRALSYWHGIDLFGNIPLVTEANPPGATPPSAHTAVPPEAPPPLPPRRRRRILFRADGAGSTKEWLAWIASGGGNKSNTWEYSVGWTRDEDFWTALAKVPAKAWTAALDARGKPRQDAALVEITDLLGLDDWPDGLRVIVRREPVHPKYARGLKPYELATGFRYRAIATSTSTPATNTTMKTWIPWSLMKRRPLTNPPRQGMARY